MEAKKGVNRRDFIKQSTAGVVGSGLFINQASGLSPKWKHNPKPTKTNKGQNAEPDGYDIIIKSGTVIDGCGNPWFEADIALKNGKIFSIGKFSSKAKEVINAQGLIVAPGIIDLHNHSDTKILINPNAESAIRQGITTMLVGNCGSSAAPQSKRTENRNCMYSTNSASLMFHLFTRPIPSMGIHLLLLIKL